MIEYYLKELEEEGVTYIPRWTPPVDPGAARLQPPPCSAARAAPLSAAEAGQDGKEAAGPSEPAAGSPDGQCLWGLIKR